MVFKGAVHLVQELAYHPLQHLVLMLLRSKQLQVKLHCATYADHPVLHEQLFQYFFHTTLSAKLK